MIIKTLNFLRSMKFGMLLLILILICSFIGSIVPQDSNIFLLIGESTMLIDTGTGIMSGPVIEHVASLLNGKKLNSIVLTHHHYDHIGGLKDFISAFEPAVFAGSKDASIIRKGGQDRIFRVDISPCPDLKELSDGNSIDRKSVV